MSLNAKHRTIGVGVTLGAFFGALTLMVQQVAAVSGNSFVGTIQRAAMVLLLPGLIGSAAVSGNGHAFSLVAASTTNMLVYFVVGVLLGKLIGRTSKRNT